MFGEGSWSFVRTLIGQLSRYATVGLISNALLYVGYLALTASGLGHKLSMTIVFVAGVLATYCFNRSWSFDLTKTGSFTFAKYAVVYVSVYFSGLLSMWLAVDVAGLPHQLVQLFLVFFSAGVIFLALRFWVFRGWTA